MAETLSSTPKVWQLRNRNQQLLSWFIWLLGTALFMYCWQIVSESTTWFFVWDAPRIAADIGGRMIPPRWTYINERTSMVLGGITCNKIWSLPHSYATLKHRY